MLDELERRGRANGLAAAPRDRPEEITRARAARRMPRGARRRARPASSDFSVVLRELGASSRSAAARSARAAASLDIKPGRRATSSLVTAQRRGHRAEHRQLRRPPVRPDRRGSPAPTRSSRSSRSAASTSISSPRSAGSAGISSIPSPTRVPVPRRPPHARGRRQRRGRPQRRPRDEARGLLQVELLAPRRRLAPRVPGVLAHGPEARPHRRLRDVPLAREVRVRAGGPACPRSAARTSCRSRRRARAGGRGERRPRRRLPDHHRTIHAARPERPVARRDRVARIAKHIAAEATRVFTEV